MFANILLSLVIIFVLLVVLIVLLCVWVFCLHVCLYTTCVMIPNIYLLYPQEGCLEMIQMTGEHKHSGIYEYPCIKDGNHGFFSHYTRKQRVKRNAQLAGTLLNARHCMAQNFEKINLYLKSLQSTMPHCFIFCFSFLE